MRRVPTRKGKERAFEPDQRGLLALEEFEKRQYWMEGRAGVVLDGEIITGINGDPSILGRSSSLKQILSLTSNSSASAILQHSATPGTTANYISEVDAYREVLGVLQGRGGVLLQKVPSGDLQIVDNPPALLHTSPTAFHSLLSAFLLPSSQLVKINDFISDVLHQSASPTSDINATIEAFAEAVESYIVTFRRWCAQREMDLLSKDVLISLLQLSRQIDLYAKELDLLSRAIDTLNRPTLHPSQTSTALIDFLEQEIDLAYSVGDVRTAECMREVFVKTVEPFWSNLGSWIHKGFLRERAGFFIERNGVGDSMESAYYAEGYCVVGDGSAPNFLSGFVGDLLAVGRAVNVLDTVAAHETDGSTWLSFAEVLGKRRTAVGVVPERSTSEEIIRQSLFSSLSTPLSHDIATHSITPPTGCHSFSRMLVDVVEELCEPIFSTVQAQLYSVFMVDFRFRHHLEVIEGIFLMRNGSEMGSFLTDLFEKVRRISRVVR